MKRLKNKLLGMQANTATYREMYEGEIRLVFPEPNLPSEVAYESIYYTEPETLPRPIGFEITEKHKLALDRPTGTVCLPVDDLIPEGGEPRMKRLKYYLLNMEPNTAVYREMYEGRTLAEIPWKTDADGMPAVEEQFDNTYWSDSHSFTIEQTNKLAKDKPTVTVSIPAKELGMDTLSEAFRRTAADHCLRAFKPYLDELNAGLANRSRPARENGRYSLMEPGGEVLTRNGAYFALRPQKYYQNGGGNTVYLYDDGVERPPLLCLCLTLEVQLPVGKLRRAIQMLCRDLPAAVEQFALFFDTAALANALALAEKQAAIRTWLRDSDYCAFIANGSILPREKNTALPMKNAVPFRSVPEDELEVCGVRGMGIRRGVTVITGGGYSGKSTLLDAISAGIYDHVAGDGRELVLTDESAVTISAEDGRSVKNVNISPFIRWVPGGDTRNFSTVHASGSTSQAANIVEAVDGGAKLLLIDEDKSATNFMIRDGMMKELIEREPITPFTDRVGELCRVRGVSTILVIGGSGEYLSVADKIYRMDDYFIHDVTGKAKAICAARGVTNDFPPEVDWSSRRTLLGEGFTSYPEGSGTERLEVSELGFLLIGDEKIDIRMLHDIISQEQLNAMAFLLRTLETTNRSARIELSAALDDLYRTVEEKGVDFLYTGFFTTCERFMELPRKAEVIAAVNRMRRVTFLPSPGKAEAGEKTREIPNLG